jgi:putative copper export protein
MTAQLRSDLLKWRTTRTLILLLVSAIGLTLLVTCAEVLSQHVDKLTREDYQRTIFSTAGGVVVLFATIAAYVRMQSLAELERATEQQELRERMRELQATGSSHSDTYEHVWVVAPPSDHGPVQVAHGAF